MQRREPEGVVIVCDFTGQDWDGDAPMIEGHQGSVISLDALAMAIEGVAPLTEPAACTLCLQTIEPPTKAWRPPNPPATANPDALVCWPCIKQADRAFARDPDTDWQAKTNPSRR